MPKRFEATMHFDESVDVVFAAQADPDYVVWKHENMAAFDVSAESEETDTTVTVRSTRRLPAELPAIAKRFVGESILVEETHVWQVAPVRGGYRGTVAATFGIAPMSVDGTLVLRPDGTGCALTVSIQSRSSVPFVGATLEDVVGEQFMVALVNEERLAPRWFLE